jgi:hypothetical protein
MEKLKMKYTLIQERDVKAAYSACVGKAFQKPYGMPDEKMFRHPV